MGGSGDWGISRSSASPMGPGGHPSMLRPGMEYNAKSMMVSRSNSVPGARSMLQQQLMDMGMFVLLLPKFGGIWELLQTQLCKYKHQGAG